MKNINQLENLNWSTWNLVVAWKLKKKKYPAIMNDLKLEENIVTWEPEGC